MENRAFHRLLSQIDKLTPTQVKQLENQLHKKCSIKTLEDVTGEADHCPHCGAMKLYKWGVKSGLQRYRCKGCGKTFNILTKTPLARLRHKEVWADYAQTLITGETIQMSAEHCKVANSTAFRWRHRMLQAARQMKARCQLSRLERFVDKVFPFDRTHAQIADRRDRAGTIIDGTAVCRRESRCYLPDCIILA